MASDERKQDKERALLETVRKARGAYETVQDDVERARSSYYDAVRRLHEAGMPLREISEQLGLSHQRVHQMIAQVGGTSRSKARARAAKALGGGGAVLLATILGVGLWMQVGSDRPEPSPAPSAQRTDRSDDKFVELDDCMKHRSDMTITLRDEAAFMVECVPSKVNYIIRMETRHDELREKLERSLKFAPADPT